MDDPIDGPVGERIFAVPRVGPYRELHSPKNVLIRGMRVWIVRVTVILVPVNPVYPLFRLILRLIGKGEYLEDRLFRPLDPVLFPGVRLFVWVVCLRVVWAYPVNEPVKECLLGPD